MSMSKLESVSTAGLHPRKRLDFWNAAVSTNVIAAAADPLDRAGFCGLLKRCDVDSIRLAEISSVSSSVDCAPTHDAHVLVQLMLSGTVVCRSSGMDRCVGPGDFWLRDVSHRCEFSFREPIKMLVLRIPRTRMQQYIACPEAVAPVVVTGATAGGALVSRFIRDLWMSCGDGEFAPVAPRFVDIALQMIASSYTGVADAGVSESSVVTRHRVRIQRHIEDHLREPELTPTRIAQSLGLTQGYLHRVFSSKGETVGQYILRRRLQECHRALSDPMQGHCSVTMVAFSYGFNSLSHFCRKFREVYGVTPRDLQRGGAHGARHN